MSQRISITSSGLQLAVPAFRQGELSYPGGTIEALPRRDQYLVLNLKTRQLHTLSRAMGEADVVLARMVTTEAEVSEIESWELELPSTHLPRTLEKFAKDEPLTVHCFGSSLVANGFAAKGWQNLLFDRGDQDGRLLVSLAVTNASFGVGGTNARYTVSLLGEGRANGQTLRSTVFDCDLAVIALLPNDGEDRLPIFEGVVRMFRERGIEVLLLTDNPFAGVGEESALWKDGEFVRQLAGRYGCGLADTAAYMREAELRGLGVYADTIHQTEAGHRCWAEAAAGALSPWRLARAPGPAATGCLQEAASIPVSACLDFTPATTGGRANPVAPGNRLARVFASPIDGATDLEVDAFVEIGEPGMLTTDLIFDASQSFAAEVRLDGRDEVLKTISYAAPRNPPAPRPQTLAVFTATEDRKIAGERYRVTVTGGRLALYAVAYQFTA